MINNDRIVPIQKCDLLSMYGTIMNIFQHGAHGDPVTVLAANDIAGAFSVEENGTYLANQPVQSMDFATGVSAEVAFVAAYDYVGMTVNGETVVPTGAVDPDGVTLYFATISDGAITITSFTPELSE